MGAAASGVAAVLFAVTPAWAAAGPITVGTTTDDGSPQSLRATIQLANSSGGGTIILQSQQTYVLSVTGDDDTAAAGDLDISSRITIDGNGAKIDASSIAHHHLRHGHRRPQHGHR